MWFRRVLHGEEERGVVNGVHVMHMLLCNGYGSVAQDGPLYMYIAQLIGL